jgi:hypothetical protein
MMIKNCALRKKHKEILVANFEVLILISAYAEENKNSQ